jgi:hypothetical protein
MATELQKTYSPADWSAEDTRRAEQVWDEYQRSHDLSERRGQAVGIDPENGEVWFGESALDIVAQRREQGLNSPLLFLRVGHPGYLYKGCHR